MVRLGECKIVSRFQTSIGQQKGNVIKEKKILSLIKEIFLLNNMYHYFQKITRRRYVYIYNLFVEEY